MEDNHIYFYTDDLEMLMLQQRQPLKPSLPFKICKVRQKQKCPNFHIRRKKCTRSIIRQKRPILQHLSYPTSQTTYISRATSRLTLKYMATILLLSCILSHCNQTSNILAYAFSQVPSWAFTPILRSRVTNINTTTKSSVCFLHIPNGPMSINNRHPSRPVLKIDTPNAALTSYLHHHFILQSSSNHLNQDETTTIHDDTLDIPLPTVNGGFTHTNASKAKISAANKGKTPWNKGKNRSEAVKARIAEGVRRKNRERFLLKLQSLGLTEEEYEQQKREEDRAKKEEKKARRTANGGYAPTDETRAKISKILKEKHARGEIKKRTTNGSVRRVGFKHTEETKQKIREAIRAKWAQDQDYQQKMKNIANAKNDHNDTDVRTKISNTLKEKWQNDPEFRTKMLQSIRKRTQTNQSNKEFSDAQKEKISLAMKRKWQNPEYRVKTLKGIKKYRAQLPPTPVVTKTKKKKTKIVSGQIGSSNSISSISKKLDGESDGELIAVSPITQTNRGSIINGKSMKNSSQTKKKSVVQKKKISRPKSKTSESGITTKSDGSVVSMVNPIASLDVSKKGTKSDIMSSHDDESRKSDKKDDGDISRMRVERRDLYDLLYGDDHREEVIDDDYYSTRSAASGSGSIKIDKYDDYDNGEESMGESNSVAYNIGSSLSFFGGSASLDDENLDDFDPYGLADF